MPLSSRMPALLRDGRFLIGALTVALIVKFGVSLLRFPLPLGYDPGLYRYLLLSYADALPWSWPDLPLWAQEHPPGMFVLFSPLLWVGVPVDAFLGWMWNAFSVFLLLVWAWVAGEKWGRAVGVLTLLSGLLSQAYFDGFAGMYWKTFLALLWMVLAMRMMERRSLWAVIPLLLTFITHHQTGLLFGLSLVSWWLLHLPRFFHHPRWWGMAAGLVLIAAVSVAAYAPHWHSALWSPLYGVLTLRGDAAPGGSFPDTLFFVRVTAVLLALGLWGFLQDFRRDERGSLWQLPVLWSAVFIVGRLVFYRRFYLQFDFFLLPFAARGMQDLWRRFPSWAAHAAFVVILLVQGGISAAAAWSRVPAAGPDIVAVLDAVRSGTRPGDTVVVLENESAPWVLGWLPDRTVGGPGLFDHPGWSYAQWEQFLYGAADDRRTLLQSLPNGTFFVDTPVFHSHYGAFAAGMLHDPCLTRAGTMLLRSVCGHP